MKELTGRVALVTGASRGLGRLIAKDLCARGMTVALAARSQPALKAVEQEVVAAGGRAQSFPVDAGDLSSLPALVREVEKALGPVSLLINNAAQEVVAAFHRMTSAEVQQMVQLNLLSPMELTRLLLPSMLERKEGHVVNVASLAGKSGPPYSETYAATKAGLRGFTQSLRASYSETGVSASVVCPGFVAGEGMFADRAREDGVAAPGLMGTARPEQVVAAVAKAVLHDVPEVLVAPGPVRLLAATVEMFPRLPGFLIRQMKLREMYGKTAERNGRAPVKA